MSDEGALHPEEERWLSAWSERRGEPWPITVMFNGCVAAEFACSESGAIVVRFNGQEHVLEGFRYERAAEPQDATQCPPL